MLPVCEISVSTYFQKSEQLPAWFLNTISSRKRLQLNNPVMFLLTDFLAIEAKCHGSGTVDHCS